MHARRIQRHFVAAMAKHLPPSASTLRLLDLDGCSGEMLSETRADLEVQHIQAHLLGEAVITANSLDAVVAYDIALDLPLLRTALGALRPGGRFIAVHSSGCASESQGRTLADNGFVRILVEPALDDLGVMIRGEKPHITADTTQRIRGVADADANVLSLDNFRGRYIHLLIQQRPNKPVWQLEPGEEITWRAAATGHDRQPILLGFSSLPKAIAFMQPAVLAGIIHDINKVGKFSLTSAREWSCDLVLNPTLEAVQGENLVYLHIDPASAEAPDE